MKKKTAIILEICTILFGAFVTFYAANMLFSDLSNMFYGVHDAYIVSSIPMFMIALDITVFVVFVMRYSRYPQYRKSMGNLYSIYLIVNSAVGIVFTVLTCIIYKAVIVNYPFWGFSLVMFVVNAGLLGVGIWLNIANRKLVLENQEKKVIKPHYVIYSAVLGGMIFFALNKFGAFIWSPLYVHWRTLYLTFPFYLSMLSPVALLTHVLVYFFDGYLGKEKTGIIVSSVIGGVSLALSVSVLVIGATHTQFISAVSPALPLERLATMPINSIAQLVLMVGFSAYYIYYAIRAYRLAKAKAVAEQPQE